MARAWRRTKGFFAVGKYRTRKGLQSSSGETGCMSLKSGFTGKPVLMIFSSGMPQHRMISRVVLSVTRNQFVGARSQEALISMESVMTVKTGNLRKVSLKMRLRKYG